MVGRYILYTVFTDCIAREHHCILYRTRCTTHILPFHLYTLIYCILYANTGYIQYNTPGLCIPQCILYTSVLVYSIRQWDSVYNHVYCIPQWDSVDMDVRIQYTEHTYSLQMYTVYIVDSFILINEEDMDLPHCSLPSLHHLPPCRRRRRKVVLDRSRQRSSCCRRLE